MRGGRAKDQWYRISDLGIIQPSVIRSHVGTTIPRISRSVRRLLSKCGVCLIVLQRAAELVV